MPRVSSPGPLAVLWACCDVLSWQVEIGVRVMTGNNGLLVVDGIQETLRPVGKGRTQAWERLSIEVPKRTSLGSSLQLGERSRDQPWMRQVAYSAHHLCTRQVLAPWLSRQPWAVDVSILRCTQASWAQTH